MSEFEPVESHRDQEFLDSLVKEVLQKFYSKKTYTNEDGVVLHYDSNNAVKDVIRETNIPPVEIIKRILPTEITPPKSGYVGDNRINEYETWEEMLVDVASSIIDGELKSRNPEVEAENIRREEICRY